MPLDITLEGIATAVNETMPVEYDLLSDTWELMALEHEEGAAFTLEEIATLLYGKVGLSEIVAAFKLLYKYGVMGRTWGGCGVLESCS